MILIIITSFDHLLVIVAVVQEDLFKLVSIVRVVFRELQEEIFQ